MNKKITFFTGSIEEGGAERVISYLTSHFIDRGKDTVLVTYLDRDLYYEIDPRVEIKSVCRETSNGGFLKNVVWLRNYIKHNSSVVVSFLATFNVLVLIATIGLNVPVLVADRNDPRYVPEKHFARMMRNFLYRFADGVIVQTKHNYDYFSKRIQKKSTIIFNPIDLGVRIGEALRTKKENLIVSVCRLMPQKNLSMLIRVFSELHREYPDYRLVVYGEGTARTDLENLVSSLGLMDYVSLPGSEKKVFDKICPARLFVLPSNYEGMPNALAEAMCLGLPCVSTMVSGATDFIKNNDNGVLIDINDQAGLKKAIKTILDDLTFAENLGKNAVKLHESLDRSIIANQWLDYVSSFCSMKG